MNKPKNILEAIEFLLKEVSWNKEGMEEFKNCNPAIYHHTTGRRLRNDWGLWNENSELHKEFKKIGIWHADDMSGILLETIHRILNKQPINLKEQTEKYKKYWGMLEKEGKVINENFNLYTKPQKS